MQFKHAPGYTVNGLTLLERLPTSYFPGGLPEYKARWRCGACGREDYIVSIPNAQKARTNSCGCLFDQKKHLAQLHERNRALKPGDLPKHFWSDAKVRHLKLGFPRDTLVSREYLLDLWLAQEEKCALSGLPIELYVYSTKTNHPYFKLAGTLDNAASVDRIDSRFGYVEGNVQWLHQHYNQLKWDFSPEYLLHLCETMVDHQRSLEAGSKGKVGTYVESTHFLRARGRKAQKPVRRFSAPKRPLVKYLFSCEELNLKNLTVKAVVDILVSLGYTKATRCGVYNSAKRGIKHLGLNFTSSVVSYTWNEQFCEKP